MQGKAGLMVVGTKTRRDVIGSRNTGGTVRPCCRSRRDPRARGTRRCTRLARSPGTRSRRCPDRTTHRSHRLRRRVPPRRSRRRIPLPAAGFVESVLRGWIPAGGIIHRIGLRRGSPRTQRRDRSCLRQRHLLAECSAVYFRRLPRSCAAAGAGRTGARVQSLVHRTAPARRIEGAWIHRRPALRGCPRRTRPCGALRGNLRDGSRCPGCHPGRAEGRRNERQDGHIRCDGRSCRVRDPVEGDHRSGHRLTTHSPTTAGWKSDRPEIAFHAGHAAAACAMIGR